MVERMMSRSTLEQRTDPGDVGMFPLWSDEVLDHIVRTSPGTRSQLFRRLHSWVAGPRWPARVVVAEMFPGR
jgi:hypothetical protein